MQSRYAIFKVLQNVAKFMNKHDGSSTSRPIRSIDEYMFAYVCVCLRVMCKSDNCSDLIRDS